MCESIEEGDTTGLGIFPVSVRRFDDSYLLEGRDEKLKVPHIGWNSVSDLKGSLFSGISDKEYFYFVHSYYAEMSDYTISKGSYGTEFSAALNKDNFYAVQFHPEKSSKVGQAVLENFLAITN